ncbi:hypothetical protein CCACVL1_01883 [Corchorus capsularis]|uniref:Uncharacterized protein n=1 Tax=Corchorus capsularis TaxID=210143 RepID=A0A1R3KEI0_COCAP|nr:hypothetical protein CCACVL1_01883 [Corchorus capsularis]
MSTPSSNAILSNENPSKIVRLGLTEIGRQPITAVDKDPGVHQLST